MGDHHPAQPGLFRLFQVLTVMGDYLPTQPGLFRMFQVLTVMGDYLPTQPGLFRMFQVLTVMGDHLPTQPGLFRMFHVPVVPSVAPKNSAINGILNLVLNSSHISGRNPFPMAHLTLWTLSRSL